MEHYSKIFGHSEDNINIKRKKCISTKRNDDTDTFDELEGRYRSNAGPFRALHMGIFQFLEGPTIIAVRPSRGPAQCRSAPCSRMEDFFTETYLHLLLFSVSRRLIAKVDFSPSERLQESRKMVANAEKRDQLPCGNFTAMYHCICDYHNLEYQEDVAWVSFTRNGSRTC